MYYEKTLSSGLVVEIRPLGWEEFWRLGNIKQQLVDEKDNNKLLTVAKDVRDQQLAYCVKGWSEMKSEASLPDVLEIEHIIDEISASPVQEGNSLPTVGGQATAAE